MISRRIAREISDKEFRNTYKRARVRTKLVYQIRALRKERDWLQGDLAKEMDKPQSTISRFEDLEYGKYTLESLFEISDAFDVAIIVEFVTYPEFLMRTSNLAEYNLRAPAYSDKQLEFLTRTSSQPAHIHDAIVSPQEASLTIRVTKLTDPISTPVEPRYIAEIKTGGIDV